MNDYKALKEKYFAYLKAYKKLNNGSLKGATSFSEFYISQTYVTVYSDPRIIALMGYN